MKSFDTNILVYASDEDCPEFARAHALMEEALSKPEEWILADQVLFEFYKALRNPRIFRAPLGARDAMDRVRFLREDAGFFHCGYDADVFPEVSVNLARETFPYQRTHDCVLAATLRRAGVRLLYTRNVKDFADAEFRVENPIDLED
jgi:predicted nucleic acid-binding protein